MIVEKRADQLKKGDIVVISGERRIEIIHVEKKWHGVRITTAGGSGHFHADVLFDVEEPEEKT